MHFEELNTISMESKRPYPWKDFAYEWQRFLPQYISVASADTSVNRSSIEM